MPRLATERVTRGLRWTGGALLVAAGLVVVAGMGFTRSIDALMAAAAIAGLALGLPGAAAFTLALWLEHIAERLEGPAEPASTPPAPPNPFREPLRRYAIAVAAVLGAWGLRAALDAYIPHQVPFITFYLAVAISAWAGGFGPAALATLLCLVISANFYLAPAAESTDVGRLMLLGLFALVCLGIAAIMAALRDALARARHLVDELDRRGAAPPGTGGEGRLRALAQWAPVPLFMTDRDLACTYCNKAWLALRGRTLTQELGHGWSDAVHPEDLARVREARESVLAAERSGSVDYRLRVAGGEYAPVRETLDVYRDGRGEVEGLVGACQAGADSALRR